MPEPTWSPHGDERERDPKPPRWALALLERRLPSELADAISGDLTAEYAARIRMGRTRFGTDAWFWAQVLTLRAGSLRRAARQLSAVRPTHERNRPGRASNPERDLWSSLSIILKDLQYAMRRLARTPVFTTVAVLSLALGIGANTAMFSVVNAILLRGLPLVDAHELVEVYSSDSDGAQYATSSHADYMDLRARNDVFQNVVATRTAVARMDLDGEPEIVFSELV
jgi:hypothetical protein